MTFDDLHIVLGSEDGTITKELKLWQSMRLSSGPDRIRVDETMKMFESEAGRQSFLQSMQAVQDILKRR